MPASDSARQVRLGIKKVRFGIKKRRVRASGEVEFTFLFDTRSLSLCLLLDGLPEILEVFGEFGAAGLACQVLLHDGSH
jgi:hypothetical protein